MVNGESHERIAVDQSDDHKDLWLLAKHRLQLIVGQVLKAASRLDTLRSILRVRTHTSMLKRT